jgi:hypothetical protein
MFARKAAVIVALCAAAGILAGVCPVKIRSLLPVGDGMNVTENPNGDGMAKLRFIAFVPEFNGPGTEAHVHLHHFKPNTVYGVIVDTGFGGWDQPAAVTTNPCGNGNWIFTFPSSGAPDPINSVVFVYCDESGGTAGFEAGEERAMGMPD